MTQTRTGTVIQPPERLSPSFKWDFPEREMWYNPQCDNDTMLSGVNLSDVYLTGVNLSGDNHSRIFFMYQYISSWVF